MAKTRILMIIGLLALFSSLGCDKLCKRTVEDVANIRNATGRPLSLHLCKGRMPGEALAHIPEDDGINQIRLGVREQSSVAGGTDSCPDAGAGQTPVQVSLSSNSYAKVKLCLQEETDTVTIVEHYQACPAGSLVQTAAVGCADED